MKHTLILYIATLGVMTVLDMIWLGGVARNFYKERMGDLMEIHLMPAIAFYLIYAAGILVFSQQAAEQWQTTLLYGALFGFFAYATYDLTNLATLKGWSGSLVAVDIVWGITVTAFSAVGGRMIAEYFQKS